jgi:hypothetical protein
MTAGITAGLLAAAVLGATFRTTRHIGIAATAALCFVHPWLICVVLVVLIAALCWKTSR